MNPYRVDHQGTCWQVDDNRLALFNGDLLFTGGLDDRKSKK